MKARILRIFIYIILFGGITSTIWFFWPQFSPFLKQSYQSVKENLGKFTFFERDKKEANYLTDPVTRGDIEITVLADGTINARKLVSVGAQVSGQIKNIYVELGDKVDENQLVAEIDNLTQQNAFKQAQATLKNMEAQLVAKKATLRKNQLTFDRERKLLAAGAGARADYDEAEAALEVTDAEIKALEAEIGRSKIAVNTAQLDLGYTKITSPISGVVVSIPVEAGQTVNSMQSAPTIMKVAQLDKMTVEAQISEADVIKIKEGLPIYFTILGDSKTRYQAKLRAVEPAPSTINNDSSSTSTSNAIYYNGLFDVDNPDGVLRISMTAQVYIVLEQAKNALRISSMAIKESVDDQGNTFVQILKEDGTTERRKIKTGLNNNIFVEIISGLKEGEKVIINSLDDKGGKKTSSSSMPKMVGTPGRR